MPISELVRSSTALTDVHVPEMPIRNPDLKGESLSSRHGVSGGAVGAVHMNFMGINYPTTILLENGLRKQGHLTTTPFQQTAGHGEVVILHLA